MGVHVVIPYLLHGKEIVRENQARHVDITYIQLPSGALYLCAIIDVYSRKVFSWNLANTMDVMLVLFTLTWAVERFGPPGISNTDQGSQFTTLDWITKWRKRPHEKNNPLIHSIHKERRKKPLMPTPYIPAKGLLDEYNIVAG